MKEDPKEKPQYLKDIEISLDLKQDNLDQPKLVLKYLVEAIRERKKEREAKFDLDILQAELDLKMRRGEKQIVLQNGYKVTEAVILNNILTDPEYQKAKREYLSLKARAEFKEGIVKSLEHKGLCIYNLLSVLKLQLTKEELK
jgi:hypothetical protein